MNIQPLIQQDLHSSFFPSLVFTSSCIFSRLFFPPFIILSNQRYGAHWEGHLEKGEGGRKRERVTAQCTRSLQICRWSKPLHASPSFFSQFTAGHCFMEPDFTGSPSQKKKKKKKKKGDWHFKANETMEMSSNFGGSRPAQFGGEVRRRSNSYTCFCVKHIYCVSDRSVRVSVRGRN